MDIQEFRAAVKKPELDFTLEEWAAITVVYGYHPQVPQTKEEATKFMARTFLNDGIGRIMEMAVTAERMVGLDSQMRAAQAKFNELIRQAGEVKKSAAVTLEQIDAIRHSLREGASMDPSHVWCIKEDRDTTQD